MSHADCKKVTKWMLDDVELDESMCIKIVKTVHRRLKDPDVDSLTTISDIRASSSGASSRLTDASVIMEVVREYLKKKGTKEELKIKVLSAEELFFCVQMIENNAEFKNRWSGIFCQYLNDHLQRLLTKELMPNFVKLLEVNKSSIIYFQNLVSSPYFLSVADDYEIKELSIDTLKSLLQCMNERWGESSMWQDKLAIAMRWMLGSPGRGNYAHELLSLICLGEMPSRYKGGILGKYLNPILPLNMRKIFSEPVICIRHEGRCIKRPGPRTEDPAVIDMTCLNDPFKDGVMCGKLWDLHDADYLVAMDTTSTDEPCLYIFYKKEMDMFCAPPKFILFDKSECMERYPMVVRSLSLDKLKKLVDRYKNLHIMAFYTNKKTYDKDE